MAQHDKGALANWRTLLRSKNCEQSVVAYTLLPPIWEYVDNI